MSAVGIGLLIIAHIADYTTFVVMVAAHGLDKELNPLVVRLHAEYGLALLTVAKFATVLLVAAVFLDPGPHSPSRGRRSAGVRHPHRRAGSDLQHRHHLTHHAPGRRRERAEPPAQRSTSSSPSASTSRSGRTERTQSRTAHRVVLKPRPSQGMSSTAKGRTSSDSGVTCMVPPTMPAS